MDPVAALLLFELIALAVVIPLYLIPTIIAFRREHPNRWLILIVNLMTGWTGLAWIAALVWALNKAHQSPDERGSDGGESGLNLFINDEKKVRVVNGPTEADAYRSSLEKHLDVTTKLSQLQKLLDSGAITRSEFDKLKKEAWRARARAESGLRYTSSKRERS